MFNLHSLEQGSTLLCPYFRVCHYSLLCPQRIETGAPSHPKGPGLLQRSAFIAGILEHMGSGVTLVPK